MELSGRSLRTEKVLKQSGDKELLLVRDTDSGERFVCRCFHGSGEVYERLMAAHCPHIPRIEAVTEADGVVRVLEEYIQGDTLASLLGNGPLPPDMAGDILQQLCVALEGVHALGVVHRDIKPENVILRGREAVLIDFDVSRLYKLRPGSDTRMMGTAGYAAPEQFGFSQTDGRADLYALGVMLNEMLTGQHPSNCLTTGEFRPIVDKCIEVNVDKRYASASELCAAIKGVGKKKTRSRYVLPLGLAALLLAGALAYGGLTSGKGAETQLASTPAAAITPTAAPSLTPAAVPIQTSADLWTGRTESAPMAFQYDLDGDGQPEDYLFGAGYYIAELGGFVTGTDSFSYSMQQTDIKKREVAPCVWQSDENGQRTEVPAFAELLEEPTITLWRVSAGDGAAPEVYSLDGEWGGSVTVNYTGAHVGVWLYEARAVLDGQVLTGTALTDMRE